MEFHCKSPIFYTSEFLSVIFIEIGSNTFKTNFLPRIWESSGVTEVKVWVYFDILFLCCAISFSPSSFSQNSLFLSFLKLLGYTYVLFLFVNYVWLWRTTLIWILRRYFFFFQKSFLLLYLWWVLIFNVIWFLSSVLHISTCVFIS